MNVTIENGSPAYAVLQGMLTNADTYKVSIDLHDAAGSIKLKANEHMWTAPLSTVVGR